MDALVFAVIVGVSLMVAMIFIDILSDDVRTEEQVQASAGVFWDRPAGTRSQPQVVRTGAGRAADPKDSERSVDGDRDAPALTPEPSWVAQPADQQGG